jgi:hypothetical protein
MPVLLLLGAMAASAQTNQTGQAAATDDHQTVQLLLQQVQQLERRLHELELEKRSEPATEPVPAEMNAAMASVAPPLIDEEAEEPKLRIRGYADVGFHVASATLPPYGHSSFALGQFNLFITSHLGPRASVLAEVVIEPDLSNHVGVDLERLLFNYEFNDLLGVSVGRYHTAIGFYSTAYHHSTWMQTAVGRPLLFDFEDSGGILPIHSVGLSVHGKLPWTGLGLHYVAEMANGRASPSRLDKAVQNRVDENNHKALNFAVFVRPGGWPGLQAGFSAYFDRLAPGTQGTAQNTTTTVPVVSPPLPRIGERIFAAHAIFQNSHWEFLNEAVLVQHHPDGLRASSTPGFYTQFSRRWDLVRPYVRYQYLNARPNEPVFADVGLNRGPSAGVRFDFSRYAAFKLQYDYTQLSNHQPVHSTSSVVSFAF